VAVWGPPYCMVHAMSVGRGLRMTIDGFAFSAAHAASGFGCCVPATGTPSLQTKVKLSAVADGEALNTMDSSALPFPWVGTLPGVGAGEGAGAGAEVLSPGSGVRPVSSGADGPPGPPQAVRKASPRAAGSAARSADRSAAGCGVADRRGEVFICAILRRDGSS
jgi:hypothetical protein